MEAAGAMQISLYGGTCMLKAVGMDVSKGRSTVAVLQPGGTVVRKPFVVKHSSCELKALLTTFCHWTGRPKL